MQVKQLSAPQLAALISFASDNGRNWKSELRDSWMTCNYSGRTDGCYLQQVRNQFGPSWLVKFNLNKALAAYQPQIVLDAITGALPAGGHWSHELDFVKDQGWSNSLSE